jgi:uncharacterized protein with PQ loop repeat
VAKVLVKVDGLNVFPILVQASKTYQSIKDTKDASTSHFLSFFFSCVALLYSHLPFTALFFVQSAAESEYISKQSTNLLFA